MLPSMVEGCEGVVLAETAEIIVLRRPPLLKATAAMHGIAEKARRATMADDPRLKREVPTSPTDSPSESFFMIVLTKPPAAGAWQPLFTPGGGVH